MAEYPRYMGIVAGNVITPSGAAVVDPYYVRYHGGIMEPCITVEASGDKTGLSSLDGFSLDFVVACAVCSGSSHTPPGDFETMRRYSANNGHVDGISRERFQVIRDSDNLPISGNGVYDVYAAYFIKVSSNEIYSTPIVAVSGVRTRAPYPHREDFENGTGPLVAGLEVNDIKMQQIRFQFDTLINFANLNEFGAGYPGAAASGIMQIACSGHHNPGMSWYTTSGTYSSDPTYQFVSGVASSGLWNLPKFTHTNEVRYQGYDFYVSYINSSGIIGPSGKVTFNGPDLKEFHENPIYSTEAGESPQGQPVYQNVLKPVLVDGVTNRKRLAFGIRDIDLESIRYKEVGSYVSKPFGIESPIYAVSLEASEQFPGQDAGTFNKWDYVKYYVQFGSEDKAEWHRISLKSRVGEVDDQGNTIPSVIVLDSMMTNDEKRDIDPIDGHSKHVSLARPVRNFRIKVDIDTTGSSNVGFWTPLIYDYKVDVLTRDALASALVERHLFE